MTAADDPPRPARPAGEPARQESSAGDRPAGVPPAPPVFLLANALLRLALGAYRVRLIVEHAERLPREPGVIIASNHLSATDPPLICLAVQRACGRRVRYMAKAEVMAAPILGRILHAYGGFAVRRGRPDREAYRMAREVLATGDWLGLAPEGTRSRTGALGEPKPGVALLAMRSGAIIVPTAIWGSERVWPVGAHLPRPFRTVRIRFGEPYRADSAELDETLLHDDELAVREGPAGAHRAEAAAEAGRGSPATTAEGASGAPANNRNPTQRRHRDALDAATEELMHRIARLLPPAYRGRFG